MSWMQRRIAGLPGAWWLALLLLVVNDHLLKGSGLLPGWLTGKLSDFAGLVVAPVLGCAALSLRTDAARAVVFGAVALAFAAIKLHAPCALAAAHVLTELGIPSRIWCDPTDLVAFSVLPYAARLARSARSIEPREGLAMPQRLALAAAACACLATSDNSYSIEAAPPFVINWSRAPVLIETEKRFVDCATGAPSSDLLEGAVMLAPAHGAAIGWSDPWQEQADAGDRSCGEATVRVAGASTRVVWGFEPGEQIRWLDFGSGNYSTDNFPVEADDQWMFELGVTVIGAVDTPALQVGSALEAAP